MYKITYKFRFSVIHKKIIVTELWQKVAKYIYMTKW